MHTIYQTKAWIIDCIDVGEANKLFWLFTEKYGVLVASAQSVRTTKSKLNPILQLYSFCLVEVVRGKDVWRITNAVQMVHKPFSQYPKHAQRVIARIALFLKRLYLGEESDNVLFGYVSQSLDALQDFFDKDSINAVELSVTIIILHRLGYWDGENTIVHTFEKQGFSNSLITHVSKISSQLHLEIGEAIQGSHL